MTRRWFVATETRISTKYNLNFGSETRNFLAKKTFLFGLVVDYSRL